MRTHERIHRHANCLHSGMRESVHMHARARTPRAANTRASYNQNFAHKRTSPHGAGGPHAPVSARQLCLAVLLHVFFLRSHSPLPAHLPFCSSPPSLQRARACWWSTCSAPTSPSCPSSATCTPAPSASTTTAGPGPGCGAGRRRRLGGEGALQGRERAPWPSGWGLGCEAVSHAGSRDHRDSISRLSASNREAESRAGSRMRG